MARKAIVYGERYESDRQWIGRQIDTPLEGYFKTKAQKRGAWVPVRVWLEDGDRNPETWELESDQKWKAEWWPSTASTQSHPAPLWQILNYLRPITKDEFQWLMLLRTMPTPRK